MDIKNIILILLFTFFKLQMGDEDVPRFFTNGHGGFQFYHSLPEEERREFDKTISTLLHSNNNDVNVNKKNNLDDNTIFNEDIESNPKKNNFKIKNMERKKNESNELFESNNRRIDSFAENNISTESEIIIYPKINSTKYKKITMRPLRTKTENLTTRKYKVKNSMIIQNPSQEKFNETININNISKSTLTLNSEDSKLKSVTQLNSKQNDTINNEHKNSSSIKIQSNPTKITLKLSENVSSKFDLKSNKTVKPTHLVVINKRKLNSKLNRESFQNFINRRKNQNESNLIKITKKRLNRQAIVPKESRRKLKKNVATTAKPTIARTKAMNHIRRPFISKKKHISIDHENTTTKRTQLNKNIYTRKPGDTFMHLRKGHAGET